MSGEVLVADAELIAHFLAKKVVSSAGKGSVDEAELAERIGEVELETQILGASFIKVHIIDPELTLLNSGWLEMQDGLLKPVEVEFPEKSKWMWVLCACEPSTDITTPNLEVTFESSLVTRLREFWGPKQAPPGTRTRAQFERDLFREAGVPCRIPGLNVVQPIEEEEKNETGTAIVHSAIEKQHTEEKVNKTKGVGHGSTITIKGQKPTPDQLALINQVMRIANKLQAGNLATEALLEACIQENDFTNNPGGGGGSTGLLQFLPSTASSLGINPLNVEQCVTAFLTKSYAAGTLGVGRGGAIEYAKKRPSSTPAQVAQAAQGSAFPEAYAQWAAEAKNILESTGGLTLSGTNTTAESDVSQLTRGTSSNPDEDSFEAAQRLAAQVDWFAFTSQVPGQPEVMFYIDGPELARHHPAAYVDVKENYCINSKTGRKEYGVVLQPTTGTIDNTTFEFRRTHKVKTKVQRRSKASKPSTPTEIRLDLVCEIDEYRAGDVFVIRGFGPLNGRWIVSDTTRNCLKDTFTKFILEPPVEPLPEPIATSKGSELTGEASATSVAGQARKALSEQQASHPYRYVYGGGHQAGSKLFGPTPRQMDCSAFASLCYQEAGLSVPGQSGATLPATNEMIAAMKKTSKPEPGDLCFFGSSTTATTHVTVYVGGGKAVSMGAEGDPSEGPFETQGPSGFLGVWAP